MDANDPLVSVVIPCHNYARYLGEAIQSVLNQTFRKLEVVVVDDGSTDATSSVAAGFPVTLLSQTNKGVCAATNNGVAATRGEFVMRLDADDVLAPEYIEELVGALQRDSEAAFAYADGAYFGDMTGRVPLRSFDAESLAEGAYAVCLALMRRSAYELVGGYDVRMTRARCEDWDMWLSFAERGMRGVFVRKPLWYYRQHGHSRVRMTLSLAGLWREYATIATLQNKHRELFAPRKLFRRLARLPFRLSRRETTPRLATMLVMFYGVMLARRVLRLNAKACRSLPGSQATATPGE